MSTARNGTNGSAENALGVAASILQKSEDICTEATGAIDSIKELKQRRAFAAERSAVSASAALNHFNGFVYDARIAVLDGIVAHKIVLPAEIAIYSTAESIRRRAVLAKQGLSCAIDSADDYLSECAGKVDSALEVANKKAISMASEKGEYLAQRLGEVRRGVSEAFVRAGEGVRESMVAGRQKCAASISNLLTRCADTLQGFSAECKDILRGVKERVQECFRRVEGVMMPSDDPTWRSLSEEYRDLMPVVLADPQIYKLRAQVQNKPFMCQPKDAQRAEAINAKIKSRQWDYESRMYSSLKDFVKIKLAQEFAEKAGDLAMRAGMQTVQQQAADAGKVAFISAKLS